MVMPAGSHLRDLIADIDACRATYRDVPALMSNVSAAVASFARRSTALDVVGLRSPGTSYSQHLLHVSADRGYSVVALLWAPGQTTPIHDHRGWCVVGVCKGIECETTYELEERDGSDALRETGTRDIAAGSAVSMLPGASGIHRVSNRSAVTTLSLHVYGLDVEHFGSSIDRRFDDVPILRDPTVFA